MGKYAKQVTAHKEKQTQMEEEEEEEEKRLGERGSIQWGRYLSTMGANKEAGGCRGLLTTCT